MDHAQQHPDLGCDFEMFVPDSAFGYDPLTGSGGASWQCGDPVVAEIVTYSVLARFEAHAADGNSEPSSGYERYRLCVLHADMVRRDELEQGDFEIVGDFGPTAFPQQRRAS